ncbi:MAG: DUF4157 domain-containing protein [Deltaproteobacteria bacterium]|nr:DUF4157 domain-containing protein [Deltaproteobacteria bacterium]
MQTKPLAAEITPLVRRQPEEKEVQKQSEEEEPLQGKLLQRQSEEENDAVQRQPEEEEPVQASENGGGASEVASSVEGGINATKGGGRPLPESDRSFFEPRFGADFSNVRIHTGSDAGQLSRQLGAQAFTVGKDVYFGEGRYDPGSTQGKRLMGHELTHVVQQGGAATLQSKPDNKGQVAGKDSAAPDVQCGFFGDLWEGAASVGRAVWSGVRSVGRTIGRGASSAWGWIRGVGRSIGRGVLSAWGWIRGVGRSIGRGILSAWNWIRGIGRSIGRGILAAWEWIKDIGRSIGRGILAAWEWVKSIGRAIGRGLLAAWEWIKEVGRAIGRGLLAAWEWIKRIARAIGRALLAAWEWIKRAGGVIWECIKGIFAGAQPKLIVNKSGDAYEQEADSVADKVLRMELPGTKEGKKGVSPLRGSFGNGKPAAAEIKRKVNINQNVPRPFIQRYAEDIHYHMTLQEAANVGYSAVEAGTVAFEDQAVDTGWRHPWITTPTEILNPLVSGRDMLHFPARSVAVGDMNRAITACDIRAFGAGLHRFQDTFSHNFTTWKIPTRRLCSSMCWKLALLVPGGLPIVAGIMIPKHAYGRGAALKHACLGFYPDEHHGEQKGRDAAMKRHTRSWLEKFLVSCRSGSGGGGGGAASPAPVAFNVTAFSATGSGNANLTENAAGPSIAAPTFRSSGTVSVTGDNAEASKWDVGYIQTVYSPYDIEARYEKSYLRYHKSSLPLRDAIAGTPAPWYYTGSFSPVTGSGTSVSESMNDTPGHRPPWNDPRVTNPNSLERYERNFNVVAWFIARRRTDAQIRHLKNVNWGFNFIVDVDKTKPVGSRATNSGSGMDGISTGNGKGPLTPKLSGTISNNANVRTLVPRPPWP